MIKLLNIALAHKRPQRALKSNVARLPHQVNKTAHAAFVADSCAKKEAGL